MRKTLEAVVYENGAINIHVHGTMIDVLKAITFIVKGLSQCENISDFDRDVFRMFIKEELAKVVFFTPEELEKETKKLKKENEELEKKNKKSLKNLIDELQEFFDGMEDRDDGD